MPIKSEKFVTMHYIVLREAPTAKGVFGLYAQDGTPIYYGASEDNIRQELLDHFKGRQGGCTKQAFFFNFELAEYPFAREEELLEEHKQKYEDVPKCNERIG